MSLLYGEFIYHTYANRNWRFNFLFQTHEDYRGLERAKEAMVDVAQHANEVKRDSEHLIIIQHAMVFIFIF